MAQIARGQVSGASEPFIEVFTSIGSSLTDPAALEFAIDDVSTEALEADPVQVYPAVSGEYAAVDLVNDRIGVGNYAAAWGPDLDSDLGKHQIRWRSKLDVGEADWTEWVASFQVVALDAEPYVFEGYTTVARMRAEGLTEGRADDARVAELIEEFSREIDSICGWWFLPRSKTLRLDGKGRDGGNLLWLPAPPIRIDELKVDGKLLVEEEDFFAAGACPTDGEKPVSYLERSHYYDRLFDDCCYNNRRCRVVWPMGQRNVEIRGVFGYTEANGTEFGRTPYAIRRACELMVLRGARPLAQDADERWRGRVISQKTNRQSITLSSIPYRDMAWDQDPEISRLLARYRRPSSVRGA